MVYGAIALCPTSRDADCHNLIRVAVDADNAHHARAAMKRAGCQQIAFLKPTRSRVEELVAQANFGAVVVSSLVTCYGDWGGWLPFGASKAKRRAR